MEPGQMSTDMRGLLNKVCHLLLARHMHMRTYVRKSVATPTNTYAFYSIIIHFASENLALQIIMMCESGRRWKSF